MDKGEALRIAHAYINSISSKYNVRQAILFGSYAKGTNHADSDIDIAIVVNEVADIIDAQIDLMKLRRTVDLRIEPHSFAITDFVSSNPVVSEILKHGIIINNELLITN